MSLHDPNALVLSATQFQSAWDCRRQWFLTKILRLPVIQRDYLVFGTVLHSVCERYLRADDLGRDEAGNPVDLYPAGWETITDENSSVTITPLEAAMIQKLITKAIEQGVLVRLPGRRIEQEFWLPCIDGVEITGVVDVLLHDEIQDHKSTKDMRWAKSPAALKKNLQMLLYAKLAIEWAKARGAPPPQEITLRHNVFCKTPMEDGDVIVQARSTKVTLQEVEKHFVELQVLASEMKLLSEHPEREWHEVRGPATTETCNAYGGCAFREICGGRESVAQYVARVEALVADQQPSMVSSPDPVVSGLKQQSPEIGLGGYTGLKREGIQMDVLKRAQEKQKARAAANGSPVPPAATSTPSLNPTPPASATVGVPATKEPKAGAPPWARVDCASCTGTGFSSNGSACRICDTMNSKEGKITSNLYVIVPSDGQVIWEPRKEFEDKIAELSGAKAATTVSAPEEDGDTETEADKTKGKKRGRPIKGFTLLVNCVMAKGAGNVKFIEEVLNLYGTAIAQGQGKASFYDLDFYQRRDRLAAIAEEIAKELGSDTYMVGATTPDVVALVTALRPFAGMVIEGVR